MHHAVAPATPQTPERLSVTDTRPRGQVLVLFALLLTFLLGTAAFVVDLAWIWVNELKVQRAADAAALAGVIYLPGNVNGARDSAHDESRKNGYTDGDGNYAAAPNGGTDVWARPDPGDPRRMVVTVSAPIETFFMQIFGFDTLTVSRDSKAEFILPVPMGSPENYYGVFGQLRTPDGGVWQANPPVTLAARTSAAAVSSSTSSTGTNLPTASTQNNAATCSTASSVVWGMTPAGTVPNDLDNRVAFADDVIPPSTTTGGWLKSSTANNRVCLGSFGFSFAANPTPPSGAPAYPGHVITGIEVRLKTFATDATGCQMNVDLMWGDPASGGGSPVSQTAAAGNTQGAGDKVLAFLGAEATGSPWTVLGGANDTWGRTWTSAQVANNNFRVRLWNTETANCQSTGTMPAGQPFNSPVNPPPAPTGAVIGEAYVDLLQVVVHYHTYTWVPDPPVTGPYNDTLNARGLWGTFINQGAEKVNGDAYLPRWNPRSSPQNAEYNPNQYYNYAIEMPAGATEGEVWIFDAPFCAVGGPQYGTGDRYFGGSTPTSAFYTLYNTFNTPFDFGDDVSAGAVSTAHTIFANTSQTWTDPDYGNSSGTSCAHGVTSSLSDGRYWHNRWYPMQPAGAGETPASGEQPHPLISGGPTAVNAPRLAMTGGNTYRLHTRSTNPASANQMNDANGHNSFSIFARAWCGGSVCGNAPQVYGLGAMEAFTPLLGGQSAQFYLAEIEAIHEGKSLEIRLWDPGDTGDLSADLRVLYPTGGAYVNADLDFAASNVVAGQTAPGASSCNSRTDETVGPPGALDPFITTNTGGSSQYNGCWLTIVIVIPNGYDGVAPTALDNNWWKIQYDMGGSPTENAFDLTTWQVTLRGNPVHLVVP